VESSKRIEKLVFTVFLLGNLHQKDRVGVKPASLLVGFLSKALYEMPILSSG